MEAGTANAIADQKQIAKWMVSASYKATSNNSFFYYESSDTVNACGT